MFDTFVQLPADNVVTDKPVDLILLQNDLLGNSIFFALGDNYNVERTDQLYESKERNKIGVSVNYGMTSSDGLMHVISANFVGGGIYLDQQPTISATGETLYQGLELMVDGNGISIEIKEIERNSIAVNINCREAYDITRSGQLLEKVRLQNGYQEVRSYMEQLFRKQMLTNFRGRNEIYITQEKAPTVIKVLAGAMREYLSNSI